LKASVIFVKSIVDTGGVTGGRGVLDGIEKTKIDILALCPNLSLPFPTLLLLK